MKKWLENNKIYFEVFSFLFLGLASILVATMSWRTSEKQLKISKADRQPIINIKRDYSRSYELISLENIGYHLFEFKLEVQSFYTLANAYNPKALSHYYRVQDCYDLITVTDESKGRVAIVYSSKSYNRERKRIKKEYLNYSEFSKYDISLRSIIKISYNNIDNQYFEKYYLIDDFKTIQIPKKKYTKLYKIIESCYSAGRIKSLKKLNFKDILISYNEAVIEN